MSKKKWLILLILVATGMAVCITTVVLVLIALFMGPSEMATDSSVPVYTSEQTDSTHPGYRRTTITSGTSVYVNDYEEYALQLINSDPTQVVGHSKFGNGRICAIPGQEPIAYLAADVGSEMPAYAVFRNSQLPPFDWRTAIYQKMEFTWPNGSGAYKSAADPALVEDVVRTLRDGTPVELITPVSITSSNLAGLHLFSDQLPGLIFCPAVWLDKTGPVYLAESFAVEFTNSTTRIHARWIPASPLFTKWVRTP